MRPVTEPQPVPPPNLDPLAGELLSELRGEPAAADIIIGGGVALQHYCAFRSTHDLDAWYTQNASSATTSRIRDAIERVAARHGYDVRERRWGETLSLDLLGGGKKRFAFQVARRDVQIDAPLESAWPPVKIETLRDAIASKMVALVERGAPRDFVDIYTIVEHDLCSQQECWSLWQRKVPDASIAEAQMKVLHNLLQIEARTPLESLPADTATRARALRGFFKTRFVKESSDGA